MSTAIASWFSGTSPICCAQGRYGEVIIVQGGGAKPARWNGTNANIEAGIAAPAAAPTITVSNTVSYYIARIDITKPGACYSKPPTVTIAAPSTPPTGFRSAVAQAFLSQAGVGEVRITDGGKHYPDPPSITLAGGAGSGATLTATLDGTPNSPGGLHHWEIIEGPPFQDELELLPGNRSVWEAWRPTTIDIPGTGSFTDTFSVYGFDCVPRPLFPTAIALTQAYTVTGHGTGTGCKLRIGFYGAGYWTASTTPCVVLFSLAWGVSGVHVVAPGSGYSDNSVVRVTIPAAGGSGKELVLLGCTPGNSLDTTSPRFKVASISITNGGTGFTVAPELEIQSTSGFGARATATVTNGAITGVTLANGGGGYRTVPTVKVITGGAEATVVARPHLRGKYQCYYRYVDNTPAAAGGPIPSNLSPVREVDAGSGTASITWSVASPTNTDSRVLTTELWRSTSNQATMLYRVATVGNGSSYTDDLTDEELRNPDRAGYAAMPIVLPNGDLNANRFTPPPTNKSAVVRFQDRFWYGVDTGGSEPNSVYFSEVDEPESVPDINEIVLQQNAKDADAITALAPFGSALLVMQGRRCYSLTFAKKPLLDASVTPLAYRGCLNQRCWDTLEGVCYVMDRMGIYAITGDGSVDDLSTPINNLYRSGLNLDKTKWNFLVVDPNRKVVRAFVNFLQDGTSDYPTRALCYSITTKTWWVEKYPNRLTAGVPSRIAGTESGEDYRAVYAGLKNLYMLDSGSYDLGRGSIVSVTLTNKGAGYKSPPTVTVSGSGAGAELQAVLDGRGSIAAIWILNGGFDYTTATISISAPNDPAAGAPIPATATCIVSSDSSDASRYVTYRYKTGNYELITDAEKGGGSDNPRSVSITYAPQPSACEIALRTYYNNAKDPRGNVASRDRGAGFRATATDGASRLDMGKLTSLYGADSGVAQAMFYGKSIEDIRSSDRHIAVELLGARRTAQPVVIYSLDVSGAAGAQ